MLVVIPESVLIRAKAFRKEAWPQRGCETPHNSLVLSESRFHVCKLCMIQLEAIQCCDKGLGKSSGPGRVRAAEAKGVQGTSGFQS